MTRPDGTSGSRASDAGFSRGWAPALVLVLLGGAILLGERPGLEKLAGGLVILAGVALITLRFGSTERAEKDKSHD